MKQTKEEEQLRGFIEKFEPDHQAIIRSARQILRRMFPSANEIVYDNYNFFVIGYGPNERSSECFISIAGAANGVGVCFLFGAKLPDPQKALMGAGKQTRFVRLPSASVLKQPEIQTLLRLAASAGKTPLPETGRGRLIIRLISKKQRPRRQPAQSKK